MDWMVVVCEFGNGVGICTFNGFETTCFRHGYTALMMKWVLSHAPHSVFEKVIEC